MTWAHICGGTATVLIVGVGVPAGAATCTATYNGVAMTAIDSQVNGSGTDGYTKMFALLNPTVGTNNVIVTITGTTFSTGPTGGGVGGSTSYSGGSGWQNSAKAAGSSTLASVAVTSATGNLTVAVMSASLAWTAVNQTLRARVNLNDLNAAGNYQMEDAAGAASVTLTGTHGNDWWGIIGLDIIASGGGAAARVRPRVYNQTAVHRAANY